MRRVFFRWGDRMGLSFAEYKGDLFSKRTLIIGVVWGFLVYSYTSLVQEGAGALNEWGNFLFGVLNFILMLPSKVGLLFGYNSLLLAILVAILLLPLFEEVYEWLKGLSVV